MFSPREWQRERLRRQPFPAEWGPILERNVAHYRFLSPQEQQALQGHVQVFLHEKPFEGCGGLEITDEIRVTIAAEACLLLLGGASDGFPHCNRVLVYPSAFVSTVTQVLPGGVLAKGEVARLGESWGFGNVVLSWDDALRGARALAGAHSVVLHEFAHQIDEENGAADGVPRLRGSRGVYATWARVMRQAFEQLSQEKAHLSFSKEVLDTYGATNPAEFFAVASEAFFERPQALLAQHPEVYAQLRGFYRLDPLSWQQPQQSAG